MPNWEDSDSKKAPTWVLLLLVIAITAAIVCAARNNKIIPVGPQPVESSEVSK